MKKALLFLGLLILVAYLFNRNDVTNGISLDKTNNECTGQERQGSCADKCPPKSHFIAYTEQGLALCQPDQEVIEQLTPPVVQGFEGK